ncbi:MAG TPA: histidine phosphatase family protein, partial [Candidatus Limnocylindria bacterium]|nr:histidine phosphatase family protein [Candidatus Limnocylindria bacterium]
MLTLLLTRHGHTVRSEPEQYLGQTVEAPLSDRGRREAELLRARLEGVPLDRIVTSPLGRAVETAAILAVGRQLEVEPDERLSELDYGAWEGLTVEQIEARFGSEIERYDADPAAHRVGGGESGAMVAARLEALVSEQYRR